ncbi:MAG TPA: TetR/AcrR family transcriptional regulator [candidate division Zixibacteria bacterium]|nr:TetR/AcrR family transcriptional regulator [candidate division Zixibacteria bacterium]
MPAVPLDENVIAELANRGIVNETFRRLTPEKKNRVYRAAIRLFGEYGYDGLAIDRLCQDIGISKGSFFQYFPSKTHLLEFVILIFDDYLAKWVDEIRNGERAVLARDRLLYLYQALVVNSKLFKDEEKFFLFVTTAMNHSGVALEGIEIGRHIREYVDEIIERGVQTKEIRGDFEVDLTGYLVSLVMEGLVRRQYSEGKTHRRQTEEYLVSFLFDGIKS